MKNGEGNIKIPRLFLIKIFTESTWKKRFYGGICRADTSSINIFFKNLLWLCMVVDCEIYILLIKFISKEVLDSFS
jgi:hypothetical protein